MVKHGLTGVHDAGISFETWDLFTEFDEAGELPLRIYAMIGGVNDNTKPLLNEGPVFAEGDDRLALRSVKLYADGALGSRGAALLHDYHDDPGNKGLLFYTDEEIMDDVTTVLSGGFQANVHAIGDAANRQVLNALQEAQRSLGAEDGGDLRNRIEHAQVVSPDDIPRFKELGIIASMQPTHATSDKNMAGDRLVNQGTVVAAGSDFPVEQVNPFFGLFSAITRQDHQNLPPGGWLPDEKLTRIEALSAFTLDAAYSGFDENRIGTLEPGKQADFIMIDRDYFEVPAEEIWQIQVLETRLSGKRVYIKPESINP
jgi:predicted amidohydrolase YtcJ